MEQNKVYKLKLTVLKEAISSLENSLNIDIKNFTEIEADAIRNGQAQKFEYSVELLWKTMQAYIKEQIGEDVSGPKPVFKSFFTNKLIDEKTYEQLFEMLDARNKLAHVYDEKRFLEIHGKIKDFLITIKEVVKAFK